MSVFKRGDTWHYEFIFAGQRIRESAHTTRLTVARECEKRRRAEMERALAGVPAESSKARIDRVSDRIKGYLAHYASSHRPKSAIFARQRLAVVEKRLGATLLLDLTEERVREYITARVKEGLSGRTVNAEVGELSRAIGVKWSAAWPRVRKVEENHEVGRALTPEEEERLLQAAAADDSPNRNRMLYTFVQVCLCTGMRSGEVTSLKWEGVDFASEVVTVGRKAKTRASSLRQIPMNPTLKGALEMHAAWYAERFGEARPSWHVFPGRAGRPKAFQGRPLDPTRPTTTIKSSWTKLRERAGVQCRLHDLRHTAATKMAEAGVPESTMLAIMGHMSRAMLERYSHVRMAAKREAVKAMTLARPETPQKQAAAGGVPPKVPTAVN